MGTPNAFSMRKAISGDSAECSFKKVDSAVRVTPSTADAAVTESLNGSMISVLTNPPGWGGLANR